MGFNPSFWKIFMARGMCEAEVERMRQLVLKFESSKVLKFTELEEASALVVLTYLEIKHCSFV